MKNVLAGIAVSLGVLVSQVSMAEDVVSMPGISVQMAKKMAHAMEARAAEMDARVVIYIAGADGRPLLLHRHEKSGMAPLEWARNKAITAYQTMKQTRELASEMKILRADTFSFTPGLPGGIPLVIDNQRYGAIGVSGAPVATDQAIAEAGLAVFSDLKTKQ